MIVAYKCQSTDQRRGEESKNEKIHIDNQIYTTETTLKCRIFQKVSD